MLVSGFLCVSEYFFLKTNGAQFLVNYKIQYAFYIPRSI